MRFGTSVTMVILLWYVLWKTDCPLWVSFGAIAVGTLLNWMTNNKHSPA